MPIEYEQLLHEPTLVEKQGHLRFCPACAEPFEPFLRGCVQRPRWVARIISFFTRIPPVYVAVICQKCKQIIGYEGPGIQYIILRRKYRGKAKI